MRRFRFDDLAIGTDVAQSERPVHALEEPKDAAADVDVVTGPEANAGSHSTFDVAEQHPLETGHGDTLGENEGDLGMTVSRAVRSTKHVKTSSKDSENAHDAIRSLRRFPQPRS